MNNNEAQILNGLTSKEVKVRIQTLEELKKNPLASSTIITELIKLLDDEWAECGRGSAFGPTGINPDTDLTIANLALEALEILGQVIVPFLLPIFKKGSYRPSYYFITRLMGLLKVQKAIPALEKIIMLNPYLDNRVNFDQFDNFPIGEAALHSLYSIDNQKCIKFLTQISNPSSAKLKNVYPAHRNSVSIRAKNYIDILQKK